MNSHPPHQSRHRLDGAPSRHRTAPSQLAPLRRAALLTVPLLLLTALVAAPLPAHAAGCDTCPEPSLAQLAAEPGFTLKERPDGQGGKVRDTYYVDAGECTGTLTAKPVITRLSAWLVLRGKGEVWNCPPSKSTDAITVTTSASDSTAWSLKTKLGAKLKGPGAELIAEVEAGITTGVTITEVTTVTKTITPAYCHRVGWEGWFEVGEFQAKGTFVFTQRFAWWTKNAATGATVHAKGDYHQTCGTSDIELGRHAPIAGYFDLTQRGCTEPECSGVKTQRLGFFPELPPYLEDPKPDESDDEESANDPDGDDPDGDEPGSDDPDGNDPDGGEPDTSNPDDLGEPPTGPLPDPLAPEGE